LVCAITRAGTRCPWQKFDSDPDVIIKCSSYIPAVQFPSNLTRDEIIGKRNEYPLIG